MELTQFTNLGGLLRLFDAQTNLPVAFTVTSAAIRQIQITPSAALDPDNNYYVQVNAGATDTVGRRSTSPFTFYFVTPSSALIAPVATAPNDKSYQEVTPIAFTWGAVSGAATYEIQISEVFDFSNPLYSNTVGTVTVTPSVTYVLGTTYFWRVRALASGLVGAWSTVYQFNYTQTSTAPSIGTTSTFTVLDHDIPVDEAYAYPSPTTLTIQFSMPIASNGADYITITSNSYALFGPVVLPEVVSYTSVITTDTIVLTLPTLTDTTIYTVTLNKNIASTTSETLGTTTTYSFSTKPTPLFIEPTYIPGLLPYTIDFESGILAKIAYKASLYSKYFWLITAETITSSATLADILAAEDPTSALFYQLVNLTARCAALDYLISQEVLSVGSKTRIGQYDVEVGAEKIKALLDLKDRCNEEKKQLMDQIITALHPDRFGTAIGNLYTNFSASVWGVQSPLQGFREPNQTYYGESYQAPF